MTDARPLPFSRRRLLQAGAVTGLGLALAPPASAAVTRTGRHVEVTDLGPGVEMFTMMSSVMVGDTVYMSTRNVEPMLVVGYHLPSRTVTRVTETVGESTQALAADPGGRFLYGCARINVGDNVTPVSTLFRIDLQTPESAMEPLADIDGLIPFAMSVSPDGKVYFAGREESPRLREYDPGTGSVRIVATPEPTAQWGRCLLATETTVYLGLRGRDPATGAARAGFYAVDRASGAATSILPAELSMAAEVRDVALIGGQLVAVNGSLLALLDPADPSAYRIVRSPHNLGKLPTGSGDKLYFAGSRGLVEHDPATDQFRALAPDGVDYGSIWGLFAHDGEVVVVSAYGLLVVVDPVAVTGVLHDLVAQGAPTGPQLAMSVAAGAGAAYVGGTHAVARHDLAAGTVENLFAAGEAKDMVVLDGRLLTGQYSGWGVMGYDPATDDRFPRLLSALPAAQNRPHDLLWDADRARLYVGSGSDSEVVGALSVFDPATSRVEVAHLDPFGDGQQVRCLARQDGTLFLGGEAVGGSQVMAWDLDAGRELWRVSLDPVPRAVCGLAVRGRRLFVLGHSGGLHVVDVPRRRVVHSAVHPDLLPDWGSLTVRRGEVYGVSGAAFFRVDRRTFEPHVLVGDLDADWYGVPRVAVDEGGRFYGVRGRHLVRIDVGG
jgi:hypothetical protein